MGTGGRPAGGYAVCSPDEAQRNPGLYRPPPRLPLRSSRANSLRLPHPQKQNRRAHHPAIFIFISLVQPAAYVCEGFTCNLPVTDPAALEKELADIQR